MSSSRSCAAGTGTARRPTYWQRRYLLRHFQEHGDEALARGAGLSVAAVQQFLASQAAFRTTAEVGRIAKREQRKDSEPPTYRSPRQVLERVTRIETRALDRLDATLLAGMLLGSLALYAATAARTVTGEDAGELLAAAHGLGVPHPPGYPLWTVLAWAADHGLPFGTVAWRVSLVSGVFSALANTLLLALLLKTLRSRIAALTGAALFAVSLTHWRQAVIPEVYGLNTFFVALAALLLVRLKERPSAARLLGLASVTGLSCTNHPTVLPVAALIAVAAAAIAPQLLRRPLVVAGAVLAGLFPLLLYVSLPLASAREPYIDWGNPESLDALLAHATRSQYAAVEAEQAASGGYGGYLRRLGIVARSLGEQFGSPWVLLLAVAGCATLFARQTGLWLFLLALGWLSSVGVTRYSAFPFDKEHVYANQIFFIPAVLALCWLLAGGLDLGLSLLRRGVHTERRRLLPSLGAAAAGALLVLLPASSHFERADRSRITLIAEYGKALLDTMESGALYFPASDHSTFAVLYWQGVEAYRTDVVVADKYGRIEEAVLDRVMDEDLQAAIAGQPPREQRRILEAALIEGWPGPVYFANRRDMGDVEGRLLEPVGPLFQVMTEEQARAWWAAPEDGSDPPGIAFWDRLAHLDLEDRVEGLDFTVQMVRGDLLYLLGFAEMRAGRIDEALATWDRIGGDLAPLKQLYNNIGSSLAEHGRGDQALPFYERALAEDPEYGMALRNAAIVHRDQQRTEGAIALLERLLAVEPDHREGRLEHAKLLEKSGRLVDALAAYEALAVRTPRDATPWVEAGSLLERHGDLDKAKDAFVEALRLLPTHVAAAEALQRLRRGTPPLLADGLPLPWPSTEEAPVELDAALAESKGTFGAFGAPMPRLPGDALMPHAPIPPAPEEDLVRTVAGGRP